MKYTFMDREILAEGRWPKTKGAAINESVKKWTALAEYLKENKVSPPMAGPNSCALCVLYFDKNCLGCPVSAKTGSIECYGTPYDKYDDAVWEHNNGKALRAARREVKFLESLK